MLSTTLEATKAILKADPSVKPDERSRLLALLRNGCQKEPSIMSSVPRLMRRREAAKLLGVTPRTVDNLAMAGALPRVKLPGRSRSVGFRESDVKALIERG